jgi:hypothetical protein
MIACATALMLPPVVSEVFVDTTSEVEASTIRALMIDNIFKPTPLWTRLASQEMLRFDGGKEIRHPDVIRWPIEQIGMSHV